MLLLHGRDTIKDPSLPPLTLSLTHIHKLTCIRPLLGAQADILMVTDGEIPMPDKSILDTIKVLHDSKGLEVHGLLVASQVRAGDSNAPIFFLHSSLTKL